MNGKKTNEDHYNAREEHIYYSQLSSSHRRYRTVGSVSLPPLPNGANFCEASRPKRTDTKVMSSGKRFERILCLLADLFLAAYLFPSASAESTSSPYAHYEHGESYRTCPVNRHAAVLQQVNIPEKNTRLSQILQRPS